MLNHQRNLFFHRETSYDGSFDAGQNSIKFTGNFLKSKKFHLKIVNRALYEDNTL